MIPTTSVPAAPPTRPVAEPTRSHRTRQLLIFAVVALGVGGSLLSLSTVIRPDGPFLIAAILFGLALPALVLTYREAGRSGVAALLRDCWRLPARWWWLPVAGFALPVLTWALGAALGGARPLTGTLVVLYTADLLIGAVVINLWEEMAWTGFFQRRASSLWGVIGGSLVTSAFFTGIHVPLAVDGADGVQQVATNLVYLAAVAVGVRLLIARVDVWSGRSLLVIGLLHSSFNATEEVLQPEFFWVRIVMTLAVALVAVAVGGGRGRAL